MATSTVENYLKEILVITLEEGFQGPNGAGWLKFLALLREPQLQWPKL